MWGPVVFSEDKLYMDLMLQSRRSPWGEPVTVGQNGAACVVGLERRIEKGAKSRRR